MKKGGFFMDDTYQALKEILEENEIYQNESMKKHTSFKIGGIADFYVMPNTIEKIQKIQQYAKESQTPLTILGNGSNILVSDKGIRGIVLKPNLLDIALEKYDDISYVTVGSGYAVSKLSKFALDNELKGLEFLAGIPGTVGGCIRMNAGAYGSEIKEFVVKTKYLDEEGNICEIQNEEHEFSYRNSIFAKHNDIILETTLKLSDGYPEEIQKKMKENTQKRLEKQPLEFPSAGSTFKRGDGFITAMLIDEAGLKGYAIGDAEVSKKHAGFIINKGNATAEDVLKLSAYVQEKVFEKFGTIIELEMILIGEK